MLSAPGSRNGEGVSQFQVGVPGRCPAPLPLGPECLPLLAVTYARLTLTTHSCKSQKDQGSHLLHRDPWGESARASMPLAHHGGKPCLRKPRQIAWNHRNRLRVQKKRLTKSQAVSVMVAGGVILVAPWFMPSEQGSTLQLVKTGISVVGFIALCLGSYFRP